MFTFQFLNDKIHNYLFLTNIFFSRFEGTRGEKNPNISHLSSISTDSGTEMHSPPFRIQTYSNQAYVRSRSPSLTRLLELFRLLQNVLIFIKSFGKIKEVHVVYRLPSQPASNVGG